MRTYASVQEEDINLYITQAGSIALESMCFELGHLVKVFISPRQAEMLLADLPDIIEMAKNQFNEYQQEVKNA